MNNLIFDETTGVKRPKNYDTFNYSDGDQHENYVYETLKKSSDNSVFSSQLIAAIKDWPSEYHLSPERANIIRPLEIQQNFDILEVGGGCGAITRYLGETGAQVTSVEGSLRRAQCIRQRCKDLDNVEVICSNIYDLTIDKKFDVITLIGVFEYSAKYSPFESPFIDSLNYYKQLLKPNGVLVIAIENQLGLKYLSGHEEDHLGKPYKGIEDKYTSEDVRTFGEEDLSSLVAKSGFENHTFLYPFPDYKLPKVIFSKDALFDQYFNCSDLLYSVDVRSYSDKHTAIYDEKLVWPVLEKNKLLSSTSNSFLLIVQNSKQAKEVIKPVLASFYTTNRNRIYNTETLFSKPNQEVEVRKLRLESSDKLSISNGDISHKLDIRKYVVGDNIGCLIYRAVEKNNQKRLFELFSQWINHLTDFGTEGEKNKDSRKVLIKAEYFDCIPSNLILNSKGELCYIDQEWLIDKQLTLSYVILRYLQEVKNFPSFKQNFPSYTSFVNKIFLKNDLEVPKKSSYLNYRSTEIMLKETIYKGSKSGPWHDPIYKVIAKKLYYKMIRLLKF